MHIFPWCRLILLSLKNLGYPLIFRKTLIHGFKCGSNIGDVEGFTIGGDLGSDVSVLAFGCYTDGSTFGAGSGEIVISVSKIFYSDSMVTLETMVKFARNAELYLSARCDKYE